MSYFNGGGSVLIMDGYCLDHVDFGTVIKHWHNYGCDSRWIYISHYVNEFSKKLKIGIYCIILHYIIFRFVFLEHLFNYRFTEQMKWILM